jgi:hypothetical protein
LRNVIKAAAMSRWMGGLQLLPGEREVLRFRPSPLGWLPRYGSALLPAAWGGILWFVFHSTAWRDGGLRSLVLGTVFAAHVDVLCGLLLGGWALSRLRRQQGLLALSAILGVAASLMVIFAGAKPTDGLPVALAAESVPLLAWAELRRLGTHHHITNLRLIKRTTFPKRAEQVERHAELSDVDIRQGPLARAADVGTLLPLTTPTAAQPLRLAGVRPLKRIRHLVEVLVRQATASDYLREQQGLERQQQEALAALQRR